MIIKRNNFKASDLVKVWDIYVEENNSKPKQICMTKRALSRFKKLFYVPLFYKNTHFLNSLCKSPSFCKGCDQEDLRIRDYHFRVKKDFKFRGVEIIELK